MGSEQTTAVNPWDAVGDILKFLFRLIFTVPPDFRAQARKEIEEGPQRRFYDDMSAEDKKAYVTETANWQAMVWACRNTGMANTFSRINLLLIIILCAFNGVFGQSARAAARAVLSYFGHG